MPKAYSAQTRCVCNNASDTVQSHGLLQDQKAASGSRITLGAQQKLNGLSISQSLVANHLRHLPLKLSAECPSLFLAHGPRSGEISPIEGPRN